MKRRNHDKLDSLTFTTEVSLRSRYKQVLYRAHSQGCNLYLETQLQLLAIPQFQDNILSGLEFTSGEIEIIRKELILVIYY